MNLGGSTRFSRRYSLGNSLNHSMDETRQGLPLHSGTAERLLAPEWCQLLSPRGWVRILEDWPQHLQGVSGCGVPSPSWLYSWSMVEVCWSSRTSASRDWMRPRDVWIFDGDGRRVFWGLIFLWGIVFRIPPLAALMHQRKVIKGWNAPFLEKICQWNIYNIEIYKYCTWNSMISVETRGFNQLQVDY